MRILWGDYVRNKVLRGKGNTKKNDNHKETADTLGTYEERTLGEFNAHKAYWWQEKQRQAVSSQLDKYVQMNDKMSTTLKRL